MKQEDSLKKRINWIDITRGYAIIIIVIVHIGLIPFTQYLQTFQLPIFAILTGLTFNQKTNFKTEFIKKVKYWLLPYILVFISSATIWNIWISKTQIYRQVYFPLRSQLIAFITTQDISFNGPLWFLPSFFIAFFITLLIIKSEKFFKSAKIYYSIMSAIVLTTGYLLSNSILKAPFSFDLSLIFSSFMILGFFFLKPILLAKKISNMNIIFCLILFLLSATSNGTDSFFGRVFNNLFLFICSSVSGSLLLCALAQKTENLSQKATNVLIVLGKSTIYIFLFHWLLILCLISLLSYTSLLRDLDVTIVLVNVIMPHDFTPYSLIGRLLLFTLLTSWAIIGPIMIQKIIHIKTHHKNA